MSGLDYHSKSDGEIGTRLRLRAHAIGALLAFVSVFATLIQWKFGIPYETAFVIAIIGWVLFSACAAIFGVMHLMKSRRHLPIVIIGVSVSVISLLGFFIWAAVFGHSGYAYK